MPEFADWTRAFAMMGTDGVDYIPVLVGADGSMYAVLQGEYEGILKTVKLDDEGRISAFVIDSVDAWGRMLSIGNAELAARLGSPVLYEQSGRVQFIETFAQGIANWESTVDGTGASVKTCPLYSRRDGYSAELIGGSDGTGLARIQHTQGGLPMGSTGLSFAYSDGTNFDNIIAMLTLYNTVNLFQLGVKIDSVNDKLKVYQSGAIWQEVADARPHTNGREIFFFVKITADLETGNYKELRFNQEVIDISAYEIVTGASVSAAKIRIKIEVTSVAGDNDGIYVDDVILTSKE